MDISSTLDRIIAIEETLSITGITNPTSYRSAVLADAPLAYYRLGEQVLTNGAAITDTSANARTATLRNSGTITSATGLLTNDVNAALQKSNTDTNGLDLPNVAALSLAGQAISIEFWAKSAAPGAFGLIAQKISGASGWIMEASGAGLSFSYDADAHVASYNATNPWDGIAHHIAMTWDGVSARFYIDGQLRQTVGLAGTIVAANAAGKALGDDGRAGSGFAGTIDELAIYGTVLTLAQVQAHYNAGIDVLPGTSAAIVKAYRVPPPESQALPDLPCVINTVTMPDEKRSSGMRERFWTVTAQIFVAPYSLESDVNANVALALLEAADTAFLLAQAATIGVTRQKFRGATPTLAKFEWAKQPYVGVQFLLELSMIDAPPMAA